LVWVDYLRGIIYSDLRQETPELRYVSLPIEAHPTRPGYRHDEWAIQRRSICATYNGREMRFVDIFPRCCCGRPGNTFCAVSRHAFTITTWALRMDDMTAWDKVVVIDCDELWSLPGYQGVVPRVRPQYPTMSLDDPDVLCFMVQKSMYEKGVDGDFGIRLIEFDSRRMELRSICCYYNHEMYFNTYMVPSVVSKYFSRSGTVVR
jgi:hypothetical protein